MGNQSAGTWTRQVRIPDPILQLFEAADAATTHIGDLDRKWDTATLPEFRDGLDHLVDAALSKDPKEARASVILAGEHLALIAMDLRQLMIHDVSRQIERQEAMRFIRGAYRELPAETWLRERTRRVAFVTAEGRKLKGGTDPVRWLRGVRTLRAAHELVVRVNDASRLAPLNPRPALAAVATGVFEALMVTAAVTLVILGVSRVLGHG